MAPINLVTADLGRHLRNGESFIREHRILGTNYYSYTYPGFPAVCHHWGAGVLFYGVWKFFAFQGLSIFYGLVLLSAVGLFLWSSARNSSLSAAMASALLMLPLIGYRTEIRPEGFSTLFLAVLFVILNECRAGRFHQRWLWLVPMIQWIWVNVHVFYGIGLCLIGIFLLDSWINRHEKSHTRLFAVILGASALLSFANPFGIQGALQPVFMFRSYGYRLAENQSAFFMAKRFPSEFVYPYFLGVMACLGVALLLRLMAEKSWRKNFLSLVLCIFFGGLAIRAVRGISVFGFFAIPLIAGCMEPWIRARVCRSVLWILIALALMGSSFCSSFFLSPIKRFKYYLQDKKSACLLAEVLCHPSWWSGLLPGVNPSAEFFKANHLQGPVFNNYDIGGYFIFHFFPKERPFVDNRPEAYPAQFFQETYNPMQEKESVWQEVDQKYNFQVIYFYRHDQTTWAQPFLIQRIADPKWAPLFVDDYTLILAKRNGVNQPAINRFELPRRMFSSTANA